MAIPKMRVIKVRLKRRSGTDGEEAESTLPGPALCGDQIRGGITKTGVLSSAAKEEDSTTINLYNPDG